MYVCMYICMYVHVYACMYIYIYMYIYACMYVCIYVCTYMCMHVCTYIHAYIYIYIYACMYVCTYIYVSIYLLCLCASITGVFMCSVIHCAMYLIGEWYSAVVFITGCHLFCTSILDGNFLKVALAVKNKVYMWFWKHPAMPVTQQGPPSPVDNPIKSFVKSKVRILHTM